MSFASNLDYEKTHTLRFVFSSTQLINIRVTVNNLVKVVQCRNVLDVVAPVKLSDVTTITIENLTPNTPCNIDQVKLNYLDITSAMHIFTNTYLKANNDKIGDFVSDLFLPDKCVITIPSSVYRDLIPYFKTKSVF